MPVKLIVSNFEVDQFQLRHNKNPELLFRSHMNRACACLGEEIISHFPYIKDEENSFSGVLPELSANKDHEYKDRYTRHVVVMDEKEWDLIKLKIKYGINSNGGF